MPVNNFSHVCLNIPTAARSRDSISSKSRSYFHIERIFDTYNPLSDRSLLLVAFLLRVLLGHNVGQLGP